MKTDMAFSGLPEAVRAASRTGLVVMIYDEIIGALHTAAEAAEARDIQTRFTATTAASEMIAQLYLSLDVESGGDVAWNLATIYTFVLGRLPRINTHNDAAAAREAIRLIEPLRDSWKALDAQLEAGEVAGMMPVPAFARAGEIRAPF